MQLHIGSPHVYDHRAALLRTQLNSLISIPLRVIPKIKVVRLHFIHAAVVQDMFNSHELKQRERLGLSKFLMKFRDKLWQTKQIHIIIIRFKYQRRVMHYVLSPCLHYCSSSISEARYMKMLHRRVNMLSII